MHSSINSCAYHDKSVDTSHGMLIALHYAGLRLTAPLFLQKNEINYKNNVTH